MADALRIPAVSRVFVRARVSAQVGGSSIDPTADVVTMAFMPSGDPGSGDWRPASWETTPDPNGTPAHYARCLVGPGGDAPLAVGQYQVFIRVIDNPEQPVVRCGYLIVE